MDTRNGVYRALLRELFKMEPPSMGIIFDSFASNETARLKIVGPLPLCFRSSVERIGGFCKPRQYNNFFICNIDLYIH